MKKLVLSIAAMAAVLSSCQMEEMEGVAASSSDAFKLEVNIENIGTDAAGTKTVLDPDEYKVAWAENDELAVVVKYSDNSYRNFKFTKSASGDNIFECENFVAENAAEYHVFYPYSEDYSSISKDGFANAAVTVGAAADAVQTGDASGVSANAPLCGSCFHPVRHHCDEQCRRCHHRIQDSGRQQRGCRHDRYILCKFRNRGHQE